MNQSMNMLDVVFPFYLILHNHMFKELLQYYLNLKNDDGYLPLDLLFLEGGVKGRSITKGLSATKKLVGNALTFNASGVIKQVTGMGKSLVDRATSKEPKKRIYCILTLFGAKFSEKFKNGNRYAMHATTITAYDAFCKTWGKTPHNKKKPDELSTDTNTRTNYHRQSNKQKGAMGTNEQEYYQQEGYN